MRKLAAARRHIKAGTLEQDKGTAMQVFTGENGG